MKTIRKQCVDAIQFAKSQEFPDVWALEIFERKVLLTILNSKNIFECDILSPECPKICDTKTLCFLRQNTIVALPFSLCVDGPQTAPL